MRICFVCLGNICRSPTAEGVFMHQVIEAGLELSVLIDSAGTAGWHVGKTADPRSLAAAAKRGYRLPSRARQFDRTDFAKYDLVLAMDRQNVRDLLALAQTAPEREKVRLFRSFDPTAPPDAEVPDPYYGGEDGFEEVLDICERSGQGLVDFVRQKH